MKLAEKFHKKKHIYNGNAVGFRVDTVLLPNKRKASREYLFHPGAVAVLPLLGKDKTLLVKQFRHPVRQSTWEIPAGKLGKRENPLRCIKRELQEETGYQAKRWTKLIDFWPTAAFSNELIHVYLAKGLKKGKPRLDHDEFLITKVWPLKNVYRAIARGTLKDSKTIISFLAFKGVKTKRR